MNTFLLPFFVLVLLSPLASAGILDAVKSAVAPAASNTDPAPEPASGMAQAGELAMGLIPSLTQNLGVTNDQAGGGVGALMQLAKSNLSDGEFGQVSSQVPGMETLLAAAPALGGKSSASGLSGMLSNVGGMAAGLSGLSKVTEQFEALGLSPDMIAQFAQLIVGYFQGGEGNTAALLEKGLGAALGA